MNRTRKIVIAGIGTAVILAVIAGMLLVPKLQTSTPGAVPPSTGGPNGGGSGNGTAPGTGTGGGTSPSTGCNATGTTADPELANGTVANGTASGGNDEANPSNQTGDHAECNATGVDHDSKGDQEASQHSHHFLEELSGDLMALGGLFMAALAAAWNGLVAQARQIAGMFLGYASSVVVPVLHR